MNWFFQGSHQISTTAISVILVLVALPFLPSLLRFILRLLQPSGHRTDAASSKLAGAGSESGYEPGSVPLYSAAVVDSQAQSAPAGNTSDLVAQSEAERAASASEYQENPSPTAIVAEVCSLQSPAREGLEQSYRGRRVRWKLRLTGVSEREQAGALHTVRMSPTTRSALACAVYFGVKLEEHPELEMAQKDALFTVEGTIANVEDYDIDLEEIHAIKKAA